MSWAVSDGLMAAHSKRDVYIRSNMAFNKTLNQVFSLPVMAERPIDRALRIAKERHLNQARFAEALHKAGLSGTLPQHITNWKKRGLPPEHYAIVARVLGITVDELLGLSNPYEAKQPSETLSVREEQLLYAFRNAPEDVKRAIEGALGGSQREPDNSKHGRSGIIEDRMSSRTKKTSRRHTG